MDGITLSFDVSWPDQQDSSGLAERQFSLKFLWSFCGNLWFSVLLWSVGVAQWRVLALAEESAMRCEQPSQCALGTLSEGCILSVCEAAEISSIDSLLKECADMNSQFQHNYHSSALSCPVLSFSLLLTWWTSRVPPVSSDPRSCPSPYEGHSCRSIFCCFWQVVFCCCCSYQTWKKLLWLNGNTRVSQEKKCDDGM